MSKSKIIALTAVITLASCMTCMTTIGTAAEPRDAITAANKTFMAAFKRADAAGMAALYTENGQLLPPGSDFVEGRPAIQAVWQGLMDMGIKAVNLETIEVEGHANTAIEVGKYTIAGEGGKVIDNGKYVVIWKRQRGQWRLHRDIWNTSVPAPTQ